MTNEDVKKILTERRAGKNRSAGDIAELDFLLDMELHDKLMHSLNLALETKESFFLSGKPGTGKSVFLKFFRNIAKQKMINFAILAPTGVAAIAVHGQTIHSFFNFDFGVQGNESAYGLTDEKLKIMRNLDVILVDECSMVRADIFDGMSYCLRYARSSVEPFGGVQMIFVGDLFQIPPVIKPEVLEYLSSKNYIGGKSFHSKEYINLNPEKIIFDHVYRQDEKEFLELLDRMRSGDSTEEDIKRLNNNRNPIDLEKAVYLCTTKKAVEHKNTNALKKLSGKVYKSSASISGSFPKTSHPTQEELEFKVGSRILLLINSYDEGEHYVNGDLGTIEEIVENEYSGYKEIEHLIVTLDRTNEEVIVRKKKWENIEYAIEEHGKAKTKELISKVVGDFVQFPFMLGYALTIHKAQGKTLDHVVIDMGRGAFVYGQSYVAVSRCTSLETLHFEKPIRRNDIMADPEVVAYLDGKATVDLEKDEDAIKKIFERIMDAIETVEKEKGQVFVDDGIKFDFAFQASEELLKSIKFDSILK